MKHFFLVIILLTMVYPSIALAITLGDGGCRSYFVNTKANTGLHVIIHRPDIIVPPLLRKETCPVTGCDDSCEAFLHNINQYGLVHKAAHRPHMRILIPEQAIEFEK